MFVYQATNNTHTHDSDASSPFVVPCSPAPDGSLFLPPGKFRTKSLDGRSSVSPAFRVVPVRAIKSSTPAAGSGGQLQLPGPGHLETKRQLSKRASLDIGGVVSGSAGGGNGSNAVPSKSPIPAYQVKL